MKTVIVKLQIGNTFDGSDGALKACMEMVLDNYDSDWWNFYVVSIDVEVVPEETP